uniref:Uncharacterized protein n=1 Tax=Cacopsylla melanoneura TaxID=428564 RepID=A0A8D8M1G0_9HEMI
MDLKLLLLLVSISSTYTLNTHACDKDSQRLEAQKEKDIIMEAAQINRNRHRIRREPKKTVTQTNAGEKIDEMKKRNKKETKKKSDKNEKEPRKTMDTKKIETEIVTEKPFKIKERTTEKLIEMEMTELMNINETAKNMSRKLRKKKEKLSYFRIKMPLQSDGKPDVVGAIKRLREDMRLRKVDFQREIRRYRQIIRNYTAIMKRAKRVRVYDPWAMRI